ncbi:MAG: SLC13 family permease [Kiritimatiellae bacterium]|nr:SLC13 family permease [Kiritimatiellia bacterium]
MIVITALAGWGSRAIGIAPDTLPVVAVCTFIGVICTTLFFWSHRVAIAFLGVAVLIGTRTMTLQGLMRATELDIIFFLVGMMIIVGALKDLGFLTWVIQSIINKKKMTGGSFVLILCGLAALLSSVVDEVSSIVVVLALVFQVCDTLKVRATPFVLIAVLCTNIGSASTMLGNPVGIFIGNKAGFTFGQFLSGATPIAFTSLLATAVIVMFWFRKPIREMTAKMEEHRNQNRGLGPLVRIPFKRGLCVLITTVSIIAFHHQIENLLGLTGAENKNAFLIVTPLIIAGLLMAYRPQRARHYVEHDVEWWTLLFFMLLFAIAGSLEHQGVTANLADKLSAIVTGGPKAMVPFVLGISSIGSAFVDNIVFVAAFTPVIQSLVERAADYSILWWALLFGACFGGNITAIGSTANIVALGLLEKRAHAHIGFLEWLKIGAVIGLVSGLIAWGMLQIMPVPHPVGLHAAAEHHDPDTKPHTAPCFQQP